MLKMGIEQVKGMGYKGITVEGNFNFYNKVGFKTSSEYNIFPIGNHGLAVCHIVRDVNFAIVMDHMPNVMENYPDPSGNGQ